MTSKLTCLEVEVAAKDLRHRYSMAWLDGVTHVRMAELTGLPDTYFSQWLSGKRPEIKRLATFLVLLQHVGVVEDEARSTREEAAGCPA